MRSAETSEVARLLALDPDVPGLRLLLDDEALTAWLADRLAASLVAAGVRRTYLRWKPGAGGVARVRVGGADLFLAVWHRGGAAKLDKTVLRGGGAVVAVDRAALAVLGLPAADRDLPGLARLLGPGPGGAVRRLDAADERARRRLRDAAAGPAGTSTLAWKPQRRWVGVVGSSAHGRVVLRAYRPHALPAVRERYRAVGAVLGGAAPNVLGDHTRHGLLAVEHLRGRALDRVGATEAAAADRAAGALLARLHGAPLAGAGGGGVGGAAAGAVGGPAGGGGRPGGVGLLDLAAECRAVEAAARTVDRLVPDAGASVLARDLLDALRALPREGGVLLHGDLSADQVVVDPTGEVGLIDLDEVAVGPASFDLAGITASWWLADPTTAEARVQSLLDGYGRSPDGRGPDGRGPDELRVRTATHLLRRAPEAFRTGRAGWPDHVVRTLRTAALTLGGGPPVTGRHHERAGVLR